MLGAFPQKLAQSGQTAGVIISVALMLFLGFAIANEFTHKNAKTT